MAETKTFAAQVNDWVSQTEQLHGGRLPGEPSDVVIEDLERLLGQAKAGRLIGLAYAGTYQDGTQAAGWSGEAGTRHPLGTAIMMLFHRYSARLFDRQDE